MIHRCERILIKIKERGVNLMKKIIKKFINKSFIFLYHKIHKKSANKVLKSIESVNGKLDPELKRQCDEYAKNKLGSKAYSPWLYVYSAMNNKFYEGWIPDNYYGAVIVPKFKGKYGELGDRKALTNILFESNLFPDLLYIVNGLYMTPNQLVLSKDEAIKILTKSDSKLVFKTEGSSQGRGVQIMDSNEDNFEIIEKLDNGVFQKFIKQHSFFSEMTSNSVATLRMTTAVDKEGNVSLRACYLRIGRDDDDIVKSKSHLRIPVNLETGDLYDFGYTTDWKPITEHPDTNYVFKGKQIPFYKECKDKILKLHSKVPFVRIIGWDVVIDSNNQIQVMEFNGGHNDIKFSEATQGPIFKDFNF